LTIEEQSKILALHRVKMKPAQIARESGRGRVLQKDRKRGPKSTLTLAARRAIVRAARSGQYTARDVQTMHAPHLSVRRVQQLLHAEATLVYRKACVAPYLTQPYKDARLKWADAMLVRGVSFWRKTVFSDEKRWSLDGPDGLSARWDDARKPRRWFGKRHTGGGSIMVWGCFSRRGKGKLIFVRGISDSVKYKDCLGESLLPYIEEKLPNWAIFQQDGASCHRSNHTKEWL